MNTRVLPLPLVVFATVLWMAAWSIQGFAEEATPQEPRAHSERTLELVVASDGRTLVSCGSEGTAKVWGTETRHLLRTHRPDGSSINALAIRGDGKQVATGGKGGAIQVWSTESGEIAAKFPKPGPPDSTVASLSFSLDGDLLAYSGDHTGVGLLSIPRGTVATTLDVSCDLVFTVRFDAASGRLAAGCGDQEEAGHGHALGTIFVWDAPYDGAPSTLAGHGRAVFPLAFSADGSTLVSAEVSGAIRVWDVAKRAERCSLEAPDARMCLALAVSPDGKSFVSVEEVDPKDREKQYDAIVIWDMGGARRGRVPTEHYCISCLAFTPDGCGLYVGSYDGSLELWDLQKGNRIASYVDPEIK